MNKTLSQFSSWKSIVVVFVLSLLFFSGCSSPQTQPVKDTGDDNRQPDKNSIYAEYSPAKIDILPLTEYAVNNIDDGVINLFVTLLDAYGSQVKSPYILRIELYHRVQRSSDPKGDRVMIWNDKDLSDPSINNEYWRNFLRAYEFNMPYELQVNQSYILEVTCIFPNSKRLSSEFILKTQPDS